MRLLAVGNPAFSLSPCHLPSIHKCHTQILKFFMIILQIRILYPKSKFPPPQRCCFPSFVHQMSSWVFEKDIVQWKNKYASQWSHTWIVSHLIPLSNASGPEAEERSRVPWNISGRSFNDFYIGRQDGIPRHLPGGLGCYYYHPLSSNKLGPHFCYYIGVI